MTVVCKGIFVKNWLSHQNCETQLQGNNAKKCTLVVVGCCGVFYKILLVVKLEWYLRILYTTHILNKLETLMAIYIQSQQRISKKESKVIFSLEFTKWIDNCQLHCIVTQLYLMQNIQCNIVRFYSIPCQTHFHIIEKKFYYQAHGTPCLCSPPCTYLNGQYLIFGSF